MGITSTGIGSGLNVEGLVSQLIAAEGKPANTRLTTREARLTSELSAFGTFKGALAGFKASLGNLTKMATFGARSASSSNEDKVTVTASSKAAAANYQVKVNQLASSHALASDSYADTASVVGNGTLTLRFGTTTLSGGGSYDSFSLNAERKTATITIDDSNNTLSGVRDAINAAKVGVTAAIVNDGSGYRLLLSSQQTGANNSIEVSATDADGNNTDANGLSALSFNSGAQHMTQSAAATDAQFTINGLSITSAKNNVSDVITGVNLQLKGLTTGADSVTVGVKEDRDAVRDAIKGLVSGYNQFVKSVSSLTSYNAETKVAGKLQGDFSVRAVTSHLQRLLTGTVEGVSSDFSTLAELGIAAKADGTLALDGNMLDKALDSSFDRIAGMFAQAGFPTDSNITFVEASDKTVEGNYAVNITQAATQGRNMGAAISFPLVVNGDNDTFSVKVNGTSSGGISLTHGSYATGAALASELQARINGDTALQDAGAQVTVSFETDHFEITSTTWGADSSVDILSVDTNTTAQLGLSVGAGTAGTNVQGTIGGVSAIGEGQLLKAAAGGSTEGIELVVQGSQIGDRGSLRVSRGIASQLSSAITGFLDADGVLSSRTDALQSGVDDITRQREDLNRRLNTLEIRYRNQFSKLDTLMAQLNSTSTFLTQQLANLPKPNSTGSNR